MRHTELQGFFRNIREKYHITQTVMAESLGITQPLLSFYENGKVNIPNRLVEGIIDKYCLNEQESDFLKAKRITKYNIKAIEELTDLQYTILINQQDNGYTDEQVHLYELLELIESKINKLKS